MSARDAAAERARLVRAGIAIEWLAILWMLVEAGIAIASGASAGSPSLLAFGLDSGIELLSAGVLLWRLGQEHAGAAPERVERAEGLASRIVGWLLLALAVYIAADAGIGLYRGIAPSPSPWGIAVAAGALVVMPLIVRRKRRIAAGIGSSALRADAAEGVVCAYMALVLLLGLLLHALFGWWWADPLAALGIVWFIVREGREALGGEEEDEEGQ